MLYIFVVAGSLFLSWKFFLFWYRKTFKKAQDLEALQLKHNKLLKETQDYNKVNKDLMQKVTKLTIDLEIANQNYQNTVVSLRRCQDNYQDLLTKNSKNQSDLLKLTEIENTTKQLAKENESLRLQLTQSVQAASIPDKSVAVVKSLQADILDLQNQLTSLTQNMKHYIEENMSLKDSLKYTKLQYEDAKKVSCEVGYRLCYMLQNQAIFLKIMTECGIRFDDLKGEGLAENPETITIKQYFETTLKQQIVKLKDALKQQNRSFVEPLDDSKLNLNTMEGIKLDYIKILLSAGSDERHIFKTLRIAVSPFASVSF